MTRSEILALTHADVAKAKAELNRVRGTREGLRTVDYVLCDVGSSRGYTLSAAKRYLIKICAHTAREG